MKKINDEWKNLDRTLEENKENHKKIIELAENKNDQYIFMGSFENEHGERYAIFNYLTPNMFRIAGDETDWTLLELINTLSGWMGAKSTFSFNEVEDEGIRKILF